MGKNFTMVAKTLFGFEEILAIELHNLGALDIKKGVRSVSFEGDNGMMYKANLACRTAIKILKPIYSFDIKNEDELYKNIYEIDWNEFLNIDKTFAIDATIHSDFFNHSKYIALKTKDAIVDKFRDDFGKRPNVDTENPDLRINIHIHQSTCTVSLDSSGNSLHMRGYRTDTNIAPINEVLAAGLLLLSGWQGQCNFIDPMCGSGTILIEAAMIACNIPANIHRKEFACELWQDYDNSLFKRMKENLLKNTREFHFEIQGYDIDFSSIKKSKININNAMVDEYIDVKKINFFDTEKQNDDALHILFNPPYDERISIDTETFYDQIGDTLKQHYANTKAWMITGNLEALKFVGLKPSHKIKVFNGALEARLVCYDIYEGSKKNKTAE